MYNNPHNLKTKYKEFYNTIKQIKWRQVIFYYSQIPVNGENLTRKIDMAYTSTLLHSNIKVKFFLKSRYKFASTQVIVT